MPPKISRTAGLDGAAAASGPTVVIDTYRAFTTAAYLLDAGVRRLVLSDGVDEARNIAASLDGAYLCGEEDGKRPDDFDLGNSPTEVLEHGELAGATVVMRTTAGTRCAAAAVAAGTGPIYAASLVVAGPTAAALGDENEVTLISSGGTPQLPHDEDELTGDLISTVLNGGRPDSDAVVSRVLAGTGTARLRSSPWIDNRDIDHCLIVNAFDFALLVDDSDDLVTLSRH